MSSFQTGLRSLDVADYGGAVPAHIPARTFHRGGLALQPRLPNVDEVVAANVPDHVLIAIFEPLRTLADPMPGIPASQFRRFTFVSKPVGTTSRWITPGGLPEALHFHFSPSALAEVAEDGGLSGFRVEERPSATPGGPELVACALEGRRELLHGDGASVLALESLHLRALVLAIRSLGVHRGLRTASGGALTPARMRRLREYVEARLGDEIALSEMADAVGVSRPHLARIFRDATGTSPYRWIQDLRIERAKTLLASGDEPIAAVALACGFGSQSHFSQVFRQVTGATPRQWRVAMR